MTAFGIDLNNLEVEQASTPMMINEILEELFARNVNPLRKWLWFGANRRFNENIQSLRGIVRQIIGDRRAQMVEGQETAKDILDILLRQQTEDGRLLDDEQIINESLLFLFAGHETTANTVSFALIALGQNADKLTELRNEVDSVIGAQARDLEAEDLKKLQYTEWVIKETLRLFPVGIGTVRKNEEELELGGYRIPANSALFVPAFAIQRNEQYWRDPHQFIPERFDRTNESLRTTNAFMAFMSGPRICIGKDFALMESKLVLAQLIYHFDFLLDPTASLVIKEQITLKPESGVPCRLNKRH